MGRPTKQLGVVLRSSSMVFVITSAFTMFTGIDARTSLQSVAGAFNPYDSWVPVAAETPALLYIVGQTLAAAGAFSVLALPLRMAWLAALDGVSLWHAAGVGGARTLHALGAYIPITLAGAAIVVVLGGVGVIAFLRLHSGAWPDGINYLSLLVFVPAFVALLGLLTWLDLAAAAALRLSTIEAIRCSFALIRKSIGIYTSFLVVLLSLRGAATALSPSLTFAVLAVATAVRGSWLQLALHRVDTARHVILP